MAQGRKYETERYYDEDRTPRGNGPAWVMAAVMVCAGLVFGAWLLVDMYPKGITLAAPDGAIGQQAPPVAVRRTQRYEQERQDGAVQTSIDQYNQDEQAKFDAAVNAGPVLAPPPLNSAGEPVIDQSQQQQMELSLQLAEQERQAAVTAAQQVTLRAEEEKNAAAALAAQRTLPDGPPDVSKAEAEKMMGRDLCSVPRANPATCKQGLYKPTPVQ